MDNLDRELCDVQRAGMLDARRERLDIAKRVLPALIVQYDGDIPTGDVTQEALDYADALIAAVNAVEPTK